jgi:hypothetical protein
LVSLFVIRLSEHEGFSTAATSSFFVVSHIMSQSVLFARALFPTASALYLQLPF